MCIARSKLGVLGGSVLKAGIFSSVQMGFEKGDADKTHCVSRGLETPLQLGISVVNLCPLSLFSQ